jgi:putative Mg2+ transporter-C (MgtC) family protein
MEQISQLEILERLGLSLLVGLLLGFEREWKSKPAGLRTYALVCEGAALFMMCSLLLGQEMRAAGSTGYDPSRIASTVVQGIGFLAGGVILARGHRIIGITTAANIWVAAAVGLLVGAGFYFLAIAATLSTLAVLGPLKWLENRITPDGSASADNSSRRDNDEPNRQESE